MGRTKTITIHDRAAAYKDDKFYVSDSTILMCGICSCRLEWEKRDPLNKHIKTSTHIKKKSDAAPAKRQATLPALAETSKRAKLEKTQFIQDTVEMCIKANIPINKLDHPSVREYLKKYVPGSGDLPQGHTLRKDYVPACGEAMRDEIKEALKGKDIVIVADETSDAKGRCVFAVLFRTMTPSDKQEVYLVSCNFLDHADGASCSQAIIDTIKEYGIEYKNILGLVSDSARYMGTCFRGLQAILGQNILHYQCWAHKVNLIGDVILDKLPEVNCLVAKIKSSFRLSRKMKSAYLRFLMEHYAHLPAVLFPTPVITRWTSWFKSVFYLDTHMEAIVAFFKQSAHEFSNSSTAAIIHMFEDQTTAMLLKVQVAFVAQISVPISTLVTTLEGSEYPFAHCLWDELECMSVKLRRNAEGIFSGEIVDLLHSNTNLLIQEKMKSQYKTCMQCCLNKLSLHMTAGPTNDAFMVTNTLFNPSVVGQSTQVDFKTDDMNRRKIPLLADMNKNTFMEGYETFHCQLVANIRNNAVSTDVLQMLFALKVKHAEFASKVLQCIWAPTNSVDAERCFSKYNLIVTDRRSRMREDTIETCSMLAFNS